MLLRTGFLKSFHDWLNFHMMNLKMLANWYRLVILVECSCKIWEKLGRLSNGQWWNALLGKLVGQLFGYLIWFVQSCALNFGPIPNAHYFDQTKAKRVWIFRRWLLPNILNFTIAEDWMSHTPGMKSFHIPLILMAARFTQCFTVKIDGISV